MKLEANTNMQLYLYFHKLSLGEIKDLRKIATAKRIELLRQKILKEFDKTYYEHEINDLRHLAGFTHLDFTLQELSLLVEIFKDYYFIKKNYSSDIDEALAELMKFQEILEDFERFRKPSLN